MTDNRRCIIMMIAAMAAFTANDACMKAATATVPLFQAIFVRGLMTTTVLGALAYATGALRFRFGHADGAAIALRTIGEIAATVSFLLALRQMPLANLSAIMQSLPLAVTLAAALLFGERVGWRRVTGIVAGVGGVLMIIRPGTEGFDRWSILGLVSVCCVVLRDMATRKLSRATPSTTVAFMAAASVAVMAAVVVPFEGWKPLTLHEFGLVALAAAFLIAGYLTVVSATRAGDVAVVAPFRYTALLFAIVLGWAMFDTLPDSWTLAGSAIVVLSGVYAFYRERQRARHDATSAAE